MVDGKFCQIFVANSEYMNITIWNVYFVIFIRPDFWKVGQLNILLKNEELCFCLEALIKVLVCFFQDASTIAKNVMIYFDNSVDSFKNPIQPCTTVDECLGLDHLISYRAA